MHDPWFSYPAFCSGFVQDLKCYLGKNTGGSDLLMLCCVSFKLCCCIFAETNQSQVLNLANLVDYTE